MIIDGDALVREGIDAGDFRGEGGIHQVAKGKSLAFGKDFNDFRSCREIENHRRRLLVYWAVGGRFFLQGHLQLSELAPGELRGLCLAVLPSVDGGKGNPQCFG